MDRATPAYRTFCRFAAVAFGMVTLYTLVVKLPSGRMDDDVVHTVLHVLTGAAAAYAGWWHGGRRWQAVLTWGIALGYAALGVVGPFVEGIALGTPLAVPLEPADDVFHLLVAGVAAVSIVSTRIRRRPVMTEGRPT